MSLPNPDNIQPSFSGYDGESIYDPSFQDETVLPTQKDDVKVTIPDYLIPRKNHPHLLMANNENEIFGSSDYGPSADDAQKTSENKKIPDNLSEVLGNLEKKINENMSEMDKYHLMISFLEIGFINPRGMYVLISGKLSDVTYEKLKDMILPYYSTKNYCVLNNFSVFLEGFERCLLISERSELTKIKESFQNQNISFSKTQKEFLGLKEQCEKLSEQMKIMHDGIGGLNTLINEEKEQREKRRGERMMRDDIKRELGFSKKGFIKIPNLSVTKSGLRNVNVFGLILPYDPNNAEGRADEQVLRLYHNAQDSVNASMFFQTLLRLKVKDLRKLENTSISDLNQFLEDNKDNDIDQKTVISFIKQTILANNQG